MTAGLCRCGTGNYCKVHQTYKVSAKTNSHRRGRAETAAIDRVVTHQQAGGGIRYLRRGVDRQ